MKEAGLQKGKWIGYALFIAALHIVGLSCLFMAGAERPTLLGLGFLAYTLGLRHAFDADHIVAIDNTIRKLMQEEKNPLGVGFYFSLGHSSVVCLMALATAFAAAEPSLVQSTRSYGHGLPPRCV